MTETIKSLYYASCDVVLEVDVDWSYRGRQREVVLAQLPDDVMHGDDPGAAPVYVRAFVEAVKLRDPDALAEVERALYAQSERRALASDRHLGGDCCYPSRDPDCCYDPNVVRRPRPQLPRRYHELLLAEAEHLLASDIPDGWLERHSGYLTNNAFGDTAKRREWLRRNIAVVRMAEALGLRPRRRFTLHWNYANLGPRGAGG